MIGTLDTYRETNLCEREKRRTFAPGIPATGAASEGRTETETRRQTTNNAPLRISTGQECRRRGPVKNDQFMASNILSVAGLP